jgi:predicted nicotinamide N-methyase
VNGPGAPEGLPLAWREVVPGGPRALVPTDPDALLDEMDDTAFRANDERMPYFALLWPSGESLAQRVWEGPAMDGLRVLDLGCGVGPVGLCAAARGARVVFLDWEPRALDLVRRSAEANGFAAEFVVADWRKPPPLGTFDRILAADVLYEERNLPAVLPFLRAHLAPGGEAWLADPGRRHAGGLEERAAEAGLRLLARETLPARAHGAEVRLHRFAV